MFRYLREPLLQFLVIGALIYSAYAIFGTPEETLDEGEIVIDAAMIGSISSSWEARMNRPPTLQELNNMIQQRLREEILYREAIAMGLGEGDPITRRRLAQKIEFLTKDVARLKEPDAGELEAYFADNIDDYREPDRITFTQVFVNPDKRGAATLDDAADLLEELKAQGEPSEETSDMGDRFMLQSYFPQKSELDVRRLMGSGFAVEVMTLEPGQWHGPVLSGYGVHLIYVHAFQAAPEPKYADVAQAVFDNWQEEQQTQFNESYYESLKNRYEIVIEDPPEGSVIVQAGSSSGEEGSAPAAADEAEEEPAS